MCWPIFQLEGSKTFGFPECFVHGEATGSTTQLSRHGNRTAGESCLPTINGTGPAGKCGASPGHGCLLCAHRTPLLFCLIWMIALLLYPFIDSVAWLASWENSWRVDPCVIDFSQTVNLCWKADYFLLVPLVWVGLYYLQLQPSRNRV